MLPSKLVFVDVETSGGSLRADEIIEIAIIRVEDNKIVQSFQSLVHPHRSVSEQILTLTGIPRDQLATAPYFEEIKDQVIELLDDCVFVAHNVRFDYGFIQTELKRRDHNFSAKQLCTVRLSRTLFPSFRHHNLDSLIERFAFECPSRHRAFDDANVLWNFYQLLQQRFPQELLEQALGQSMHRPSIPLNIPEDRLNQLPEQPGVYIFYGSGEVPLYIGKSVNIKQRVLSHFSQNHTNSLEMKISQQIERIETIETAGELGALLKESELIKKMQPVYNRRLRLSRELVVVQQTQNEQGYSTVQLESFKDITPDQLPTIMGIFRSQKQAKQFLQMVACDYQLCPKLLKLETSKGACFDHRLERCKGACIGSEKVMVYNLRFLEAFTKYKIQRWPYSEPILISESDPISGKKQHFLVDNWCVLGVAESDQSDAQISTLDQISFDLDAYKILRSFLAKKGKLNIKPLVQQQDILAYSSEMMYNI